MRELFLRILAVSAMGAAAGCALRAVSWLFRKKIPPLTVHLIWAVLLVRLLVPSTLPSGLSAYSAIGRAVGLASQTERGASFREEAEAFQFARDEGQLGTDGGMPLAPESSPGMLDLTPREQSVGTDWGFVAAYVWAAGGVAVLLWFVLGNVSVALKVRGRTLNSRNQALLERAAAAAKMRPPRAWATEFVSVSAVFGLRPTMLVREEKLEEIGEEAAYHVFLHELEHIRHGDPLLNWIGQVCLALHWFNPLVWIGVRQLRASGEMAADESVLRRIGACNAGQYGLTLIGLAQGERQGFSLSAAGDDARSLRARVRAIGAYSPRSVRAFWLSGTALALLCALLLTGMGGASAQTVEGPASEGPIAPLAAIPEEERQEETESFAAIDPEKWLEELYRGWLEDGEELEQNQTFWVDSEVIAQSLQAKGERELSGWLTEQSQSGGKNALGLNRQTLFFQGEFGTSDGERRMAAVVLNGFRDGICLVFEQLDGWRLTGFFPCGEAENLPGDYSNAPVPMEIRLESTEAGKDGMQTWLVVPGWVNSGTGLGVYDEVWYNLGQRRTDLRCVTYHYNTLDPVQCIVSTGMETAEENGLPQWSLNVHCALIYDYNEEVVVEKDFALRYEWDAASNQMALASNPGGWRWASGTEGYAPGDTEIQASDVLRLFAPEVEQIRQNGSGKQRAWLDNLEQLNREEGVRTVTVEAPDGVKHQVGRYLGYAPAPRLDFLEAALLFQARPGEKMVLSFESEPEAWSLSCWDGTGASCEAAREGYTVTLPESRGICLFTLDAQYAFGEYTYDIVVELVP